MVAGKPCACSRKRVIAGPWLWIWRLPWRSAGLMTQSQDACDLGHRVENSRHWFSTLTPPNQTSTELLAIVEKDMVLTRRAPPHLALLATLS